MQINIAEPEKHEVHDYDKCDQCSNTKVHGRTGLCRSCYYQTYIKNTPHLANRRKEQARLSAQKIRSKRDWYERTYHGIRKLQRGGSSVSKEFLQALQVKTLVCSCCNTKLDYTFHPIKEWPKDAPTIDKIIPSLGYIESNVAILCKNCNLLKNKATIDDVRMVLAYLEKMQKRSI